MTTKVNGVIDTAGFDTLGGINIYKVVTSSALTTAADGSGTLDEFVNKLGFQPVIMSEVTATGFSFGIEHDHAVDETTLEAMADVTSVNASDIAGA